MSWAVEITRSMEHTGWADEVVRVRIKVRVTVRVRVRVRVRPEVRIRVSWGWGKNCVLRLACSG